MKSRYLLLAALPLFFTSAYADDGKRILPAPKHNAVATQPSGNVTRFADRCTDFTANGWAFKSPRNFLKWLDVFTDPAIYLEFANRGLDPQSYVRTLSSMLDPGTPRNYLEWSNPEIYNQWAQAAAQPEYYTAINSILFDPGRMMRWAMLPIDGRAWNVVGNALSPNTWLKWLNAPADPKTQELFAKAANLETAQRWLEALGDPNNMPWFNAPTTTYGAQPASRPSPAVKPAAARISL